MEVMTVEEAAKFLKISEKSLLKSISNGTIPYLNLDGEYRVLKNALIECMTSTPVNRAGRTKSKPKKYRKVQEPVKKDSSSVSYQKVKEAVKSVRDDVFYSDELVVRIYENGRIYFNTALRGILGVKTSKSSMPVTLDKRGGTIELVVYESKDAAPYKSLSLSNGIFWATGLLKAWGADLSADRDVIVKKVSDKKIHFVLPETTTVEPVVGTHEPMVKICPNGRLVMYAKTVRATGINIDTLYDILVDDDAGVLAIEQSNGTMGYRPFMCDDKLCFDLSNILEEIKFSVDEDISLSAQVGEEVDGGFLMMTNYKEGV